MTEPDARLVALLAQAAGERGPVVFLTGAGISAESGVPTFRGPEGYWRIGGRNHRPMELATRAAFRAMPEEIWAWYLHRRATCRAAAPNAAHDALVRAEASLGERFLLVTQNVDGLHLRAGQSFGRTYQIHGNIDYCRDGDDGVPTPLPASLPLEWPRDRRLGDAERALLRGARGGLVRPHVLWFDESYDERLYRFESALTAVERAAALIVVGSTGATTLPVRMAERAVARRIPFVVIGPERTHFSELAARSPAAYEWMGLAGTLVPRLARVLTAIASP